MCRAKNHHLLASCAPPDCALVCCSLTRPRAVHFVLSAWSGKRGVPALPKTAIRAWLSRARACSNDRASTYNTGRQSVARRGRHVNTFVIFSTSTPMRGPVSCHLYLTTKEAVVGRTKNRTRSETSSVPGGGSLWQKGIGTVRVRTGRVGKRIGPHNKAGAADTLFSGPCLQSARPLLSLDRGRNLDAGVVVVEDKRSGCINGRDGFPVLPVEGVYRKFYPAQKAVVN